MIACQRQRDGIEFQNMQAWLEEYKRLQEAAVRSIPLDKAEQVVRLLVKALHEDRQVFVFGNGGSAANSSHFATDLGKGASDKLKRRFRVVCLNDSVPLMTAISNDYAYEDVFWRQLANLARPGDLVLALSVSGNSPNCVKAFEWAKQHQMVTVALVGGKRGRLAEIADHTLVTPDTHYGRVEDAHMTTCHLLCYAFMENPQLAGDAPAS